MVEAELTPRIVPWNPAWRSARAKDPPMSPTPKMETVVIPAVSYAVRPIAAAIARVCFIMSANWAGLMVCAPSLS